MRTLEELRKNRNLTQLELARLIGVSQVSISKIESGKRRPSPEVAQRIAHHFDLTTDQMWEMFYHEQPRHDDRPATREA